MKVSTAILKAILLSTAIGSPATAQTAEICGWYAIAFCSPSQDKANDFMNNGWGTAINTNSFDGLKPGFYCVVSGPQPKASAERDMRQAIANGVAPDVYIKRACADESLIGD